ncbi:uncharacterized protein GLRG_03282 [Colletotrichum graminicola M1.001]|uniref:Uncharacterized protein n=1 Tax=Colletotrichum graminicola (strain M1.001 / M2 / FGSC 10212) TaxID=645133 RepID=E3QBA0_COLGM|nr:uncharacterized protein GLRG_03282 [Colletotrichum graminicola M1.001]EFQ28138.1 hypothetical protein GLRG_03282 [Colletotrichum graminicola M1.001]
MPTIDPAEPRPPPLSVGSAERPRAAGLAQTKVIPSTVRGQLFGLPVRREFIESPGNVELGTCR